ncbi:MAG: hypothetical protein M3235_14605, partial [Actinomycetota bacterium]|nr:hypothetical protein [Actinomycetota bacterium]
MSAPDPVPDQTGTDDAPWPVVRRATTRFVRICRAGALVALAYGLLVVLLAVRGLHASAWLWVAILVGALVHLAGVVGLWFLPPRSPSRLAPRPGGPGSGMAAARA